MPKSIHLIAAFIALLTFVGCRSTQSTGHQAVDTGSSISIEQLTFENEATDLALLTKKTKIPYAEVARHSASPDYYESEPENVLGMYRFAFICKDTDCEWVVTSSRE